VEGWLSAPNDETLKFFLSSGEKGFISFDLKDCEFGYQETHEMAEISEERGKRPYCLIVAFPNDARLVFSTDEP